MRSAAQEEQSHVNAVRKELKSDPIMAGVDGFQGVGGGRYVRAEDETGKSETEEHGEVDELKLIRASEGQDWQALENLWYQYELDKHESEPFPTEQDQTGVDSQRMFATIEKKSWKKLKKSTLPM